MQHPWSRLTTHKHSIGFQGSQKKQWKWKGSMTTYSKEHFQACTIDTPCLYKKNVKQKIKISIDQEILSLWTNHITDPTFQWHFLTILNLEQFSNNMEKCNVQSTKRWNRTAAYPIQLSNKLIMFVIYYDNTFYKNVNYVILLAKWYIHRQVYLKPI